ncbi:MAG: tetratricopeptide repeat protein [Nitrospirota bacterium]
MMTIVRNRSTVLIVVLLTSVVLLTYGNSVLNGFVWDDHDIIVNNAVNRDITNAWSLFSSADSTVSGNQKAYYRPLNRLTYLLEYQVFGLNPSGYHLLSVLIHLLTVLLLYFAARFLFKDTVPAFIAALVFAVHPINAEAVNFISARNSMLCAAFVLSAVLAFFSAAATRTKSLYYLSGFLFFAGLLCKEQAIMLPLVLLVYTLTQDRTSRPENRQLLFSLIPFGVAATVYLALRMHALSAVVGISQPLRGLGERLLQNIYIIPKYAAIMLYPVHLNALYAVTPDAFARPLWLVLAWTAIIAAFLMIDKKSEATRFGLIWAAVNFIPISNIIPIPSAPMAERYVYLPAIGLWIVAADQAYNAYKRSFFKKTLAAVGTLLVLCCAMLTINRNFDWKDDLRFFTQMTEADPNSALAHFSLGLARHERNDDLQAREEWEKAAAIDPRRFFVFGRLGESFLMSGDIDRAEYYYQREIETNPDDAAALYNLAVIKDKMNKPGEAQRLYELFLTIQPNADQSTRDKVVAKITLLKKRGGNYK